ncbi:MAG TPA: secondary thiamine-phosphate synthase enzyme YjbQ [Planctomycetota bacterium]|nr:secondary thiamine-phosphate synthase enzyme YjbQ [Planctomycetota bacterium]
MQVISVSTSSRTQFVDVTAQVRAAVKKSGVKSGICVLFVPHTTAAVTINENADPDVTRDMRTEIDKVIPFDDGYAHTEGNSAAHIKSSLVGCDQTLLVEKGEPVLGTWQGVYFCEFDGPRSRKLYVKVIPDPQ